MRTRLHPVLALALAVAACDHEGASPSGADAAAADGATISEDAGVPLPLDGVGAISFSHQPGATTLFASFERPPDPDRLCARTALGACTLVDCRGAVASGELDSLVAGALAVDGALEPIEVSPDPETATYLLTSAARLWSEGARLRVQVAGSADVPAFEAEIETPRPPGVTQIPPHGEPYVVHRDVDLALRWEGGTGTVSWDFSGTADGAHVGLVCAFDAADEEGTVPASALARLPAGSGTVRVGTQIVREQIVERWRMTLSARETAAANATTTFE